MKVLSIGLVGLLRFLRDRSNIFFVFILPLAIILMVGAQFGSGGGARVVVSHDGGDIAQVIVSALSEEAVVVDETDDPDVVIDDVERGNASAGVIVPDGLDEAVARGETAEVGFVARPDSPGSLQPVLAAAVAEATADQRVARVVAAQTGVEYPAALETARGTETTGISVETETVGDALFGSGVGQFWVGASQQLVLFVFLMALTGSASLIQSRQLGITDRMLSTPTSTRQVVVGEGMACFFVGIFQGLYIVVVTLVVFGVDWGNPLGWIPLLVGIAATGAGAAMLLGSWFDNDQQAAGISVMVGLGMGALGGTMMPLEFFSGTMARIAHLTPHAWAVEGFSDLVYRGGSLSDVAGDVAVLAGYAALLLLLAGWRLRRVISRG